MQPQLDASLSVRTGPPGCTLADTGSQKKVTGSQTTMALLARRMGGGEVSDRRLGVEGGSAGTMERIGMGGCWNSSEGATSPDEAYHGTFLAADAGKWSCWLKRDWQHDTTG